MNREDFVNLPPSIALGLLWDHSSGIRNGMANVEAPKPSRSPKFDSRIYRRGGFMWASECDLEGLRFWHKRYEDSANGGGQYAEKDAKRAKALSFWITWRQENPMAIWRGERDHEQVTAKSPASKPEVYASEQRGSAAPSTGGGGANYDYGDDNVSSDIPDDDVPFIFIASGPLESWNRGAL